MFVRAVFLFSALSTTIISLFGRVSTCTYWRQPSLFEVVCSPTWGSATPCSGVCSVSCAASRLSPRFSYSAVLSSLPSKQPILPQALQQARAPVQRVVIPRRRRERRKGRSPVLRRRNSSVCHYASVASLSTGISGRAQLHVNHETCRQVCYC